MTTHHPLFALRALALLVAMALLLAASGWLWAGRDGAIFALALSAFQTVIMPMIGTRTVMRMLRAEPVTPFQLPELYDIAMPLAQRAGLSRVPDIYLTPSNSIEAMAVSGGKDDALALSAGALTALGPREMAGVLAHEMSHLAAGDIRLFRVVGAMAVTVRFLSVVGVIYSLLLGLMSGGTEPPLIIVAGFFIIPMAATLAEAALWRTREFAADAGAVRLTGDPRGLANALFRIERLHAPWLRLITRARGIVIPGVLRTHPPTRQRIERLLRERQSY